MNNTAKTTTNTLEPVTGISKDTFATIMRMVEPEYLKWRRTPLAKRNENYAQFRNRVGAVFGLSNTTMNRVIHVIRYREVAIKRNTMAGEMKLYKAVDSMPVRAGKIARLAAERAVRLATKMKATVRTLGGNRKTPQPVSGAVTLA